MKLQEKFPDIELMTVMEILSKIGWEYEPTETGAKEIKCCGKDVTVGGFFGAEYAYCDKCGKSIKNITGVHRVSNSTVGIVNFDDVDDMDNEQRLWYINNKGE